MPYIIDENDTTTQITAELLLQIIKEFHGLPLLLISDGDYWLILGV